MIRVASLLHDYGKIGVDDSILKKPGRLTPEEYDHIKTHAPKTKSILEQVNFEGIYTEVPEIAGSHHEKLDGTGYPNGLTGDQIHFGAKIIAVADVFEALTSKRHYRDPMKINDAFENLLQNIGVHFDKQCVEALIDFYNNSYSDIPYVPNGNLKTFKKN
jgi:HD-GYP domain-containing protein (c-di-GMP phosphodiesterase class II)